MAQNGKSPAVALLGTLQAMGSDSPTRLAAAEGLKSLGVAARPVVGYLGAQGAIETHGRVQEAIVDAIIAAGGPRASGALAEIEKAPASDAVSEKVKGGIQAFRREAAAARRQARRQPAA